MINSAINNNPAMGIKRQHSKTFSTDEPLLKERITEEIMSSKLQEFHISDGLFNQDNQWRFMRDHEETFGQIEERLVNSDEEQETNDTEGTIANIEFSPEMKRLIKKREPIFGPNNLQPNNLMQIVLWKPRDDFIDNILNKTMQIIELDDDYADKYERQESSSQIVTFPEDSRPTVDSNQCRKSSNHVGRFVRNLINRKAIQNRRAKDGVIIEEMEPVHVNRSDNFQEESMDYN